MKSQNNNIHILIVDDEDIVVSLVSDTLEDEGFEVTTTVDPLEALKIGNNKHIDILVTDIRMPNMNGIDMVKKIHETQPHIAVIFMTGYANLNSAKEAIKEGACDYILKPFELHEIRQAVQKAVALLKKEETATTTSKQLDHLSNFNEMLFTAGDKNSLVSVTLGFILNQVSSNYGALLNWSSGLDEFRLFMLKNGQASDELLPTKELLDCFNKFNLDKLREPKLIESLDENDALPSGSMATLRNYIFPDDIEGSDKLMIIPVYRSLSIYGLLMIKFDYLSNDEVVSYSNFLQITAHQLAISLENLDLLEESRKAYSSLKSLQDETIQLEKMATQGEMSAEIGHELNNFLAVVTGNLQILEHQVNNQKYDSLDKHIKAMNDNLNQIKKFTSNLMELRRISTQKEPIIFNNLLSEVIDYLKPQKRYQGVKLCYTPSEVDLPFEADQTHIQQLLYNLFNNAADATKSADTKKIEVQTYLCDHNDNFCIEIKDSGAGFTKENLEKAFSEKFTTKDSGHGFGLLVCKRIVENHGGTIEITSEPNKGSTFTLQFPLLKDSVAALQPA